MASRSFQTLFLRAREHFDANGRHVFLTLSTLVCFQLVILGPQTGSSPSGDQSQQAALESVPRQLEALRPALERAEQQARETLAPAVDQMLVDLGQDLGRLQAALELAGSMSSENPDTPTTLAVEPPTELPLGLDADTFDLLVRSPNRYATLTVLEPIVQDNVLAPRFAALDRAWKERALPELEADIEATSATLSRLRTQLPEPRAAWEDLIGGVAGLRRFARELDLSPPERAYWWASPEGSPELSLGLRPEISEQLRQPRALDEWNGLLSRTLANHGTLLSAVEEIVARDMATRQRAAERRNRQGGALAAIGIDLDSLAGLWPLVLGLVLGASQLRRDQRRRELALATHFLVSHGGPRSLVRWCLLQLSASRDAGARLASLHNRLRNRTLLGLCAAWGWIALTGWLTYGFPFAPARWWPAAAGALVILAVGTSSLSLSGRLLELLGIGSGDDGLLPEDDLALPDPDRREQELTGLELR